jgi:hypothetical protein
LINKILNIDFNLIWQKKNLEISYTDKYNNEYLDNYIKRYFEIINDEIIYINDKFDNLDGYMIKWF